MGSLEMAALLAVVGDGIKVLRQRGVEVTDEQVEERANNIVAAIVGNYLVVPLPPEPVETRPSGVVPWHGWSCRCSTCADAKQKERA